MQDIEDLINQYKESGNSQIITEAMHIHVNDLLPALGNLRWMKYDTMFVEENKEESTLVQEKVSIHYKDYIIGKEPEVINFTGMEIQSSPEELPGCPSNAIVLPNKMNKSKKEQLCDKNVPKKQLTLKLHPDKNSKCKEDATSKFQKITTLCQEKI